MAELHLNQWLFLFRSVGELRIQHFRDHQYRLQSGEKRGCRNGTLINFNIFFIMVHNKNIEVEFPFKEQILSNCIVQCNLPNQVHLLH